MFELLHISLSSLFSFFMFVLCFFLLVSFFFFFFFFFSSRRRHTRSLRDWSSDVCSSDLDAAARDAVGRARGRRVRDAVGLQVLVRRRAGVARPIEQPDDSGVAQLEIGRASCRERV